MAQTIRAPEIGPGIGPVTTTAAPTAAAAAPAATPATVIRPVALHATALGAVAVTSVLGGLFLAGTLAGNGLDGPAGAALALGVLVAVWGPPALILVRATHTAVTLTPDTVAYATLRWTRQVPRERIGAVRVTFAGVALLDPEHRMLLPLGALWDRGRARELVGALGVERVG